MVLCVSRRQVARAEIAASGRRKKLLILVKNPFIKRCPQTSFLTAGFQCVVCPGITGVKQVILAFGFIKCIVIIVISVGFYVDKIIIRIGFKAGADIFYQSAVLFVANEHLFTIIALLQVFVKCGMHG